MKATKRNTEAEALAAHAKRHNAGRGWRVKAERIEASARAMAERYAEPIREGRSIKRHPLNTGATAALAELDNLRRAVDAGDAAQAASVGMAAILALWTAADTFAREGGEAQGLTLWRGLVIDATPAEAVLLNATREADAIDLPGDLAGVGDWTRATGSANRDALKVSYGKLNKRMKTMGLPDRFKMRGDRLILTA